MPAQRLPGPQQPAQPGQVARRGTEPAGLDQNITDGRCLGRPATTGRPQASAVSWQSSSFLVPPPTMCTVSACLPVSSCTSAIA